MTATVALGDAPVAPFWNVMTDCPEMSSRGFLCHGMKDHTRGDMPHVAYGFASGCMAIWDDIGNEVDVVTHEPGATLADAVAVTS